MTVDHDTFLSLLTVPTWAALASIFALVYCNVLLMRRVRILEQHGPVASARRIEGMAEAQRLQLEYNKHVEEQFDRVSDHFARVHERIEGFPMGGPYR